MNYLIRVVGTLLCTVAFSPKALASTPNNTIGSTQNLDYPSEYISAFRQEHPSHPAKKEETKIRILQTEKASIDKSGDLPEYFGAIPGGLIAGALIALPRYELISHYNLESTFLLSGIIIGFLYTYTTHVRKKAMNEQIQSLLS